MFSMIALPFTNVCKDPLEDFVVVIHFASGNGSLRFGVDSIKVERNEYAIELETARPLDEPIMRTRINHDVLHSMSLPQRGLWKDILRAKAESILPDRKSIPVKSGQHPIYSLHAIKSASPFHLPRSRLVHDPTGWQNERIRQLMLRDILLADLEGTWRKGVQFLVFPFEWKREQETDLRE